LANRRLVGAGASDVGAALGNAAALSAVPLSAELLLPLRAAVPLSAALLFDAVRLSSDAAAATSSSIASSSKSSTAAADDGEYDGAIPLGA
jgi:hypothetical protein